ncbi:MAG: radical SAM protein [bacterium]
MKVKSPFDSDREFDVIDRPRPHIVVSSQKELHGWPPGKRECTAERMLINPYNGCSHGCWFCYAQYNGYFALHRRTGVIAVFEDLPRTIARQLDGLDVASCAYLSPATDPFQPLDRYYHLSEKIVREFISRDLPVEFITKGVVPEGILDMIEGHPHSFGQVSILTLDDTLRHRLTPFGASTRQLLENIERMARRGIFAVCRIDPILPYINDEEENLRKLVREAVNRGAKHIVSSCLDIFRRVEEDTYKGLENFSGDLLPSYRELYVERIRENLHARIEYRRRLFATLRQICDESKVTFALCMEYERDGKRIRGLNRDFATSRNCEGIDIPIYRRRGNIFVPISDCDGACLRCSEAVCGLNDLAMSRRPDSKKNWKLADYRRWSRELRKRKAVELSLL